MTNEHHDLKRRAAFSAAWTLARIGSDQGFAFVIFVVLARLLSPHDMGVFALALVVAELGRLIASAGFPEAVIREPELDAELADSIFWLNFGFAAVVCLVLVALAQPIAWFFREQQLVAIVCTLALVLPLSSLGSIHTARTLREFGHRSVATRSLVSNLLGGGAAIVAARAGFGAWSMVLQRVIVEAIVVLLAWHAYPWLPARRFAKSRVGGVIRFSVNTMLSQVLLMVMMRSQDVIIGRVLSVSAVGIYRLGWRAIDLLIQICVAPFATIALPTLSRLHANTQAFGAAVLRFNAVIALIACPAMLGFGAVAPQLVPLVFGTRWSSAGQVAQVLSLLALPYATSSLTGPVFSARGAAQTSVRLAWFQLLVALPVVLLAAPYGPIAVAIAYVARGYLIWPFQVYLMLKECGISLRALSSQVMLPIVSALLASGLLLASSHALLNVLSGWHYVIPALLFEALIYALTMWIFGREFVRAQWHSLRALRAP
jgi:O-antigen/teichoic acid export membrane protein